MHRLPFVIFMFLLAITVNGQSPHGENMKMNCADCHTSDSWTKMRADMRFDHNQTRFNLEGQHAQVDCKACHSSLIFSEVLLNCYECHTDVHQQTVGMDCARCHTASSWLVDDVTGLHQENGFPLLGAHAFANCFDCHISESNLRFDRIGNDCINCHQADYEATTRPNHKENNFSLQCTDCHDPNNLTWNTDIVDHSFFPLIKGHDIQDCSKCHTAGTYQNTSSDCVSCHLENYQSTRVPNHIVAGFSLDCKTCHTIDPGWIPASFAEHDASFFPIYSGKHQGTWTQCVACHDNPSDYSIFTCIGCHTNPETDQDHTGIPGYSYNSPSCLACHPTGDGMDGFNHNNTAFPLTGAHLSVDCALCHANGYAGTPMNCDACHLTNYDQATNPNHSALGLPIDCATCHTTDPGWQPALFPDHNNFYLLEGAHALIAQDCAACHNGEYNNTPTTCIGCHEADFTATTAPNHSVAGFSTDCTQCHDQNKWIPSTFDHDGAYFPIYSGKHLGTWTQCIECHTIPGNFMEFSCIGCHTNPETDQDHTGIPGYSYNSPSCLACHPTGDAMDGFNHNNTAFPLTGAHLSVSCAECHTNGYAGTPMNCDACHLSHFNEATNPNHINLGLPINCEGCHTTNPGWSPALFPNHDNYWILDGAHIPVANDCAACHNGNFNNTPNTCVGCHQANYNSTTNPNHITLGLSTDCITCHTTDPDWQPALFPDHDQYYLLEGAHALVATNCAICHNGEYNNTPSTCIGCHQAEYNATSNPNHSAAQFSTDCALCHSQDNWIPATFDHDAFYFPIYSGEHQGVWTQCIECHTTPGNYMEFSCIGCHLNPETDQDHQGIPGYNYNSQSCFACHPSGSADDAFDHNLTNFPLTGAHTSVDCATCHTNGYAGTPTQCNACHSSQYNQTTNPNHAVLGFSVDCSSCHTTNPGWTPAQFPDHNNYWVIDGAHLQVANDCNACHNGNYNNTQNTCVGCHQMEYNGAANPNHNSLGFSTDCISCHTTNPGWTPAQFPDHNNYWVIDGAHIQVASDCAACHNGNYNNTPNTCLGCHQTDYNNATNPGHAALGISTDCAMCHTRDPGWSPAQFPVHNNYWVIDGAHLPVANDCAACHNGNYNNTPNTCVGCHQADYNNATNPNHSALGIPTDCAMCHITNPDWMPATFPIHDNYWPLNGAHQTIANQCAACHNGNYSNTPNTCFGCHQQEYNNAANPNHLANLFPQDCAACHTENAWSPSSFDHNAFWTLFGAHALIANDCNACHQGNYNNTPNTCQGCHTPEYNQTTNPNHQVLGLPMDCAMCHTTDPDWIPATFSIHDDFWPLTGQHAVIANDCVACHNGNYNNTPNTCYGCHQAQYNATNNPDHQQAGFPTDCEACHTTTSWIPSSWDHDGMYFPIYSGKHEGEWNQCIDCHTTPGNYSLFSCIDCHEHDDPVQSADDHQGVPGYFYNSQSCYTCHPQGEK